MSSETSGSSLSDGFRSLALAPDLRDLLAGLAQQVEELSERVAQATAVEAVIARAYGVPRPRPRRGRRHLRALPALVLIVGLAGPATVPRPPAAAPHHRQAMAQRRAPAALPWSPMVP